MSMSTSVVGFRPPDEKWRKMKAVWDACVIADTDTPDEVDDFFGGQYPDEQGVIVDIEETEAVKEWCDDSSSGFEVDITKLPKDVKIIRFFNSW